MARLRPALRRASRAGGAERRGEGERTREVEGFGADRGEDAEAADVGEDVEVADHDGGEEEGGGEAHELVAAPGAEAEGGDERAGGEQVAEVLALDDELDAAVAEGLEDEERADEEPPPLPRPRAEGGSSTAARRRPPLPPGPTPHPTPNPASRPRLTLNDHPRRGEEGASQQGTLSIGRTLPKAA